MGRIKIKKNDVWIDMTPMSDVMVLLLTFFMLSANFVKNEVVKVITPSSETMAKVPASATLDITIDPEGRVLLATDKTVTLENALKEMMTERNVELTAEQKKLFLAETQEATEQGLEGAIVSTTADLHEDAQRQLAALPCPVLPFTSATHIPIANHYGSPGTLGMDRLAAANVKNVSLSNFDALSETAAEMGLIKADDIARLKAFRANPSDESWIHQ